MSSLEKTEDQPERDDWGPVEFRISDKNVESFINLLNSTLTLSSSTDRVFQEPKSIWTIESIKDDQKLLGDLIKNGEVSIYFMGYEIFEGKATKRDNLINFCVQRMDDTYFQVTGSTNPAVGLFFSQLLQDIAEIFKESSTGINEYFTRVQLALESLADNFDEGIDQKISNEGLTQKNSKFRKNQPKRDAIMRVAVALFFMEIGDTSRITDAANKFNTNVNTIKKYEHHSDVVEYLRLMRIDRAYAYKLRQEIGPKRKKK